VGQGELRGGGGFRWHFTNFLGNDILVEIIKIEVIHTSQWRDAGCGCCCSSAGTGCSCGHSTAWPIHVRG